MVVRSYNCGDCPLSMWCVTGSYSLIQKACYFCGAVIPKLVVYTNKNTSIEFDLKDITHGCRKFYIAAAFVCAECSSEGYEIGKPRPI